MRHVIVALDVVEVHRFRHTVVLIKIAQIRPEIRVIDNTPQIAFEVTVVNRVERISVGKRRQSASVIRLPNKYRRVASRESRSSRVLKSFFAADSYAL